MARYRREKRPESGKRLHETSNGGSSEGPVSSPRKTALALHLMYLLVFPPFHVFHAERHADYLAWRWIIARHNTVSRSRSPNWLKTCIYPFVG